MTATTTVFVAGSAPDTVDARGREDGEWVLYEAPASVPLGLALNVHRPNFNGLAPCNGFLGNWSDETGPAGGVSVNAASCGNARDEAEEDYVAMLRGVSAVETSGDTLTLSGTGYTLVYRRTTGSSATTGP